MSSQFSPSCAGTDKEFYEATQPDELTRSIDGSLPFLRDIQHQDKVLCGTMPDQSTHHAGQPVAIRYDGGDGWQISVGDISTNLRRTALIDGVGYRMTMLNDGGIWDDAPAGHQEQIAGMLKFVSLEYFDKKTPQERKLGATRRIAARLFGSK